MRPALGAGSCTYPETTAGTAAGRKARQCPGVVVLSRNQADSDSSRLAMADLRFAAWFLWITPLLAALSS